MSLTGNENHDLPLATAASWTKNYRDASAAGVIKAHYFGKAAIQALLNQEECVGLRIYYALDENGAKQLIIVGVKANEDDLYNGVILDRSYPCPSLCGAANPLNS
jgi:hypothetical protein